MNHLKDQEVARQKVQERFQVQKEDTNSTFKKGGFKGGRCNIQCYNQIYYK
jgi:hypothetical protein